MGLFDVYTPPVRRPLGDPSDLTALGGVPAIEQPVAAATAAASPPAIELAGLRARAANVADPASEWRGVGGLPRSLAGMEQDLYARRLINAENDEIQHGIDEAAARRPDPMRDQIVARQKDLAYERLQPAGSRSHVRGFYGKSMPGVGGNEIGGDYGGPGGERAMGGDTIEERHAFEQAQRQAHAQSGYKNQAEAQQAVGEFMQDEADMRRSAQQNPQERADLENRVEQARRNLELYLSTLGVKGVYDPKKKPASEFGIEAQ